MDERFMESLEDLALLLSWLSQRQPCEDCILHTMDTLAALFSQGILPTNKEVSSLLCTKCGPEWDAEAVSLSVDMGEAIKDYVMNGSGGKRLVAYYAQPSLQ